MIFPLLPPAKPATAGYPPKSVSIIDYSNEFEDM
jgi:hypothetical protein